MSDREKSVYVKGLGLIQLDIESTLAGDGYLVAFTLSDLEVGRQAIHSALTLMVLADCTRLRSAARKIALATPQKQLDIDVVCNTVTWVTGLNEGGDLAVGYCGIEEIDYEEVEKDAKNVPLPGQTPIKPSQARAWANSFGHRLERHVRKVMSAS